MKQNIADTGTVLCKFFFLLNLRLVFYLQICLNNTYGLYPDPNLDHSGSATLHDDGTISPCLLLVQGGGEAAPLPGPPGRGALQS